jgi:hypothetical protein
MILAWMIEAKRSSEARGSWGSIIMNIWMNQVSKILFIYLFTTRIYQYDESDPIALAVLCIIHWLRCGASLGGAELFPNPG